MERSSRNTRDVAADRAAVACGRSAKDGDRGFVIRAATIDGQRATVIAGNRDIGVLYGVFRFLRQMQTNASLASIAIAEAPRVQLRCSTIGTISTEASSAGMPENRCGIGRISRTRFPRAIATTRGRRVD